MGRHLAPIVLFVYNRPRHTQRTLEALMKNRMAEESVVYIYADGPKENASPDEVAKIAEVRQVIHSQQWCREVIISEPEYNKGLADSIVGGVTEVINRHKRVIVLEDDIITSPGFLEYMNDALDFYEQEEKVMHITGYMYPHTEKLPETYFFNVPYPGGGWATWQRAWKYFNNDTGYLYNYFNTARGWWRLNKFGGDFLQRQLEGNRTGELKSWFIKWHATLLIRGGFTLYPGTSLTNNIGFDDSGSNCSGSTKFDVDDLADKVMIARIPLKENRTAKRMIRRFYQGPFTLKKSAYELMTRFVKKVTIHNCKNRVLGK